MKKSITMLKKFEKNLTKKKKKNAEGLTRFVFKILWNKCVENYSLCLSHFSGALALSWYAMLSMTKVVLDLISDVDLFLSFKKGMRDDFSFISKRYTSK